MWAYQCQMARSLSQQRRTAQTFVEIYDSDHLLSPILSESEPDEDEDCTDQLTTISEDPTTDSQSPTTSNRQYTTRSRLPTAHSNQSRPPATQSRLPKTKSRRPNPTEVLSECSHRLRIEPTTDREDLDLSEFEREEQRCNKEEREESEDEEDIEDNIEIVASDSDSADCNTNLSEEIQNALDRDRHQDEENFEPDIAGDESRSIPDSQEEIDYDLQFDPTSDSDDNVLSESDTDTDSSFDKEEFSEQFTVEIVGNNKSLREVIDTVDEAFSLDIDTSDIVEFAPQSPPQTHNKHSCIPKRSRFPTPQEHGLEQFDVEVKPSNNKPVAQKRAEFVRSKANLKLSTFEENSGKRKATKMSDPIDRAEAFIPFAPPPDDDDIFEPKPLVLESLHDALKEDGESVESTERKFDVGDDSFRVRERPVAFEINLDALPAEVPTEDDTKQKDGDDGDYCDSLEGEEDATEDIQQIAPLDHMFEDELKAEANALADSIAKSSTHPDAGEEPEHKDQEPEGSMSGSTDSLEPELEALDDAATLRKQSTGSAPLGPPRCANVKKPDIEAIRRKLGTVPKFKARPSPFSKKKDKDKGDKAEDNDDADNKPDDKETTAKKETETPPEKKEKDPPKKLKIPAPKPKARPPIPPPSPRAPFNRSVSLSKASSGEKTQDNKPHSTHHNGMLRANSTAASDSNGTGATTTASRSGKVGEHAHHSHHKDGDDPLAHVLQSKVGEGLMANLLDLGKENGTGNGEGAVRTRRSSASGESVTSAGAESSSGPRIPSLATPGRKIVETKSSMRRKQAIIAKTNAPVEEENDDYLTPSQRKDKMLKDLKKELKNIQVALACKEVEMHDLLLNKEGESWERLKGKEEENSKLRKELVETKDALSDMETKLTEMTEKHEGKKTIIKEMEAEMDRREHANQEMYLKMYEKGQQSAVFERQDQLAKMAEEDPDSVSPSELLAKLEMTQKELQHWQALKRQESYDDAQRPETPAEARLNFLKDSMYHYLTDREMEAMHLRAMVGLLGFTDVQIRKIKAASKESKGRKGSTK